MSIREINLVPSDILLNRNYKRHLWLWSVCLLVVLAPIIGFHAFQVKRISTQKRTGNGLAGLRVDIQEKVKEINRIQASLEQVNGQLKDLASVAGTLSYSRIIHRLADTMDRRTWLKTLQMRSLKPDEGGVVLRIAGYASSSGALGNFLNRLSGDPLFENAILNYAKEPPPGNSEPGEKGVAKQIEFEVECKTSNG